MSAEFLDSSGDKQRVEFAHVFAQHYGWLQTYVLVLVGNRSDAEEVFQDVCLVLWKKHEAFDVSTNFMKWASVIAHYEVRRFRRTQSKVAKPLSDEILAILATEAVERADKLPEKRTALQKCIKKLKEQDQELLERCYSDASITIGEVAQMIGKSANTLYKAMNRIRRSLHDCILRTMAAEETA